MAQIEWKTKEEIEQENIQPPTEIELLKAQNAELNLNIIDIWETLLGAGVAE